MKEEEARAIFKDYLLYWFKIDRARIHNMEEKQYLKVALADLQQHRIYRAFKYFIPHINAFLEKEIIDMYQYVKRHH